MSLYSELLDKKSLVANIVLSVIFFLLIFILYLINSYYIKPLLLYSDSLFSYFMINYFNDFWAAIFIVFVANFIVLITRKQYINNIIFYVVLWLVESFIWEFVRPYILIIFNPLNKIPKFLWGDIVVYGVGVLIGYFVFIIFNFTLRKKNERAKKYF